LSQADQSRVSLSLDEFIALNDEVVALIRAGVPLEQGLVELGEDLPGRLGHVARDIGQRIQAGETLGHILMAEGSAYPPLWRAVVAAGLRTGKLVTALEGISATARNIAEMHHGIRAAMIYPWVVTALAFGTFVLLVTQFAPRIANAYRDLTSRSDSMLEMLVWLGNSAKWWGTLIPIAAAIYLLTRSWGWRRANRSGEPRFLSSAWQWWPGMRRALRNSQMATFAETLALLLGQRVPLEEALLLAGDASGDSKLASVTRTIGNRLQRGEVITPQEARSMGFPPLLAWLITNDRQHPSLQMALSQVADRCRQRAARDTSRTIAFLPIAVTAVIGGLVTLVQAIALFWPITRMMYDLGSSSS
jgi:type II secretory pathway component PulF